MNATDLRRSQKYSMRTAFPDPFLDGVLPCQVQFIAGRSKTVQSSSRRRRRIAPPTMPRWPGTQTSFLLRSYIQPPCVEVTRHLYNDPQYKSRPWLARRERKSTRLKSSN